MRQALRIRRFFSTIKWATLQNNIRGLQFVWTEAVYVKEDDLCTPSQRLFHSGTDCLKSYRISQGVLNSYIAPLQEESQKESVKT